MPVTPRPVTDRSVLAGTTAGTATGTTYYVHPGAIASAAAVADESNQTWIAPSAGVLRTLTARNKQAPPAGNTCTLTVRNVTTLTDTALTLTWNNAGGANLLQTVSGSVSVAAGDRIIMKYVAPAAASAVDLSWALLFEPTG